MVRRVRLLVIGAVLLLGFASHLPPASASAAGSGGIDGIFSSSPIGMNRAPETWWLSVLHMAGTISATSGTNVATYSGALTASMITGGSPNSACTDAYEGPVNSFTIAGTIATGSVSATLNGTYTRTGWTLTMTLTGTATVTSLTGTATSAVNMTITGNVVPGQNCVTAPVTSGTFAGNWTVT